jgi:hypothetical protein
METVTMEGGSDNIITYERENKMATAYHKDTPKEVRYILENAIRSRSSAYSMAIPRRAEIGTMKIMLSGILGGQRA